MPTYKGLNVLKADRSLPHYFWDGETKMNCVRHAVRQSLDYGYAHHIQRLMVTGNFMMMAGIDPDEVDAWYLGIYIDALEWVQLPNTRGMSQFADGGIVGTKPYHSSAQYINKMSNYCGSCSYRFKERIGDKACPFNSLYWDFLMRHEATLYSNRLLLLHRLLRGGCWMTPHTKPLITMIRDTHQPWQQLPPPLNPLTSPSEPSLTQNRSSHVLSLKLSRRALDSRSLAFALQLRADTHLHSLAVKLSR
jgi:hypothetical protein